MSIGARLVGAIAGGLGVVAATACLDINPMWAGLSEGSTEGSSGSATTAPATTGPPTTGPMTTGPTTTLPGTVGSSDATMGSSGPPPACGDGAVDVGEECDDGPANGDTAACTSSCKLAACGDGLLCDGCGEACDDGQANADDAACTSSCKLAACGDGMIQLGVEECDLGGQNADDGKCTLACTAAKCGDLLVHVGVEECDDGDMDDKDGCLSDCSIPTSCKQIKVKNPAAADGQYLIDPDAGGMIPFLPVECDMTIAGGGWTVVEKSPVMAPIGAALFLDKPINMGNPMMAPHRLPKQIMLALQTDATEMRIDCNGPDYLLAPDSSLFAGEKGFVNCTDTAVVTFKEAKLGLGPMIANAQICVQLRGSTEGGCPAAFGIDEKAQNLCGLPAYPFGGQQVLAFGAFAFAPDSPMKDQNHDCHKAGGTRYVMLR